MDVIVLAGGEEITNKAFYKIKDKYMIEYVVEALRKSDSIDRIAVVGPKDKIESSIGGIIDNAIEGTDSIVSNVFLALECFPEAEKILLVTSDIPMITGDAIEDLIARCMEKDVDLCYSIVDKKVNDQKYPGIRRTYVRLWEGRFTGGNVFYFNPVIKDKCRDFVEKMLEYRKSPAKMAGILGFAFLLRLALGILTINAIERKCESLLGIRAAAIISPYPEISNDVDRLSDLEFIERYM